MPATTPGAASAHLVGKGGSKAVAGAATRAALVGAGTEIGVCRHTPPCPPSDAADRYRAHVIASHPEQGWSLLCNGVIVFDDLGALLPGRAALPSRAR